MSSSKPETGSSWAAEFDHMDGRIWLNTAHQGPLPRVASGEAEYATWLKQAPYRISDDAFAHVPEALRAALAELVGAQSDEIVLGNSTSHGLHLIANGLAWRRGDEVITIEGDYPATVLPWLRLQRAGAGVEMRTVRRDASGAIDLDHLESTLTQRTRVVALTWVDSFTGAACDLDAIGTMCHAYGAYLVVNGSQAVGARTVRVQPGAGAGDGDGDGDGAIDALVSCGYKWLCGPYGSGFTWLNPRLLAALEPRQAYWLAQPAGENLEHMQDYRIRDDLGARAFDVFCPANFLVNLPWTAAVQLFNSIGVDQIERHDQLLVQRLLDGIDERRFGLVGPQDPDKRSTLVVLRPRDQSSAELQARLGERGIDVASREGNLRLAPHLFNTIEQIDRALEVLAE
jgi:cysteine desulfurase / selenocysteine lyase